MSDGPKAARSIGPRAVLARVAPSMAVPGTPPIVIEPEVGPIAGHAVIDGQAVAIHLVRRDATHAIVVDGAGDRALRHRVVMLPLAPAASAAGRAFGVSAREVIVDGWRVVVEIESAQRAALRERARTGSTGAVRAGPTEMRATIPGQVLAVSIAMGDLVVAGQALVVVEAMKMQNELTARHGGLVTDLLVEERASVSAGQPLLKMKAAPK